MTPRWRTVLGSHAQRYRITYAGLRRQVYHVIDSDRAELI